VVVRWAFLVFLSAGGIWAAPLSGDRKPFQVVAPTGNLVDEPQLSPDSHWLAFNSSESGRSEIYVQPFPERGERVRITTSGGAQPKWRADGKELFFLALDGTLMSAEMKVNDSAIAPTTPRPLFQTGLNVTVYADQYAVTGDGQRFILLKPVAPQAPPPITIVVNWPATLKQ
jgi:hypothetical protein